MVSIQENADVIDEDIIVAGSCLDSWSRTSLGGVNFGDNKKFGRGSSSGWTLCPLCEKYSKKKFAIGRGIANHLIDVHTPWKPSKLAQKIHKRKYETKRRKREMAERMKRRRLESKNDRSTNLNSQSKNDQNINNSQSKNDQNTVHISKHTGYDEYFVRDKDDDDGDDDPPFQPLTGWEPSSEEKKQWDKKVLKLLRNIEQQHHHQQQQQHNLLVEIKNSVTKTHANENSTDKSGKNVGVYRESLPPFIMAASTGDTMKLKTLVEEAKQKDRLENTAVQNNDKDYNLRRLLNETDRHKSIADHWAAGGGHLDCLKLLYEVRGTLSHAEVVGQQQQQKENQKSRIRRRDGKTCLHYACRNGKIDCIHFLLEGEHKHIRHDVDEKSGDETTPLHLACYGGHPTTVRYLVHKHGAKVKTVNLWGCSCSHWVGMTICKSKESVRELCRYLSDQCEISFTTTQGQGHTALHKAAHRLNRHVIEWMAGSKCSGGAGLTAEDKIKAGAPDQGGHKPSDIWRTMGGDKNFQKWMNGMGW